MDNLESNLRKSADFTIRVIILFTTIVSLSYYSQLYNQLTFSIIGLLFLFAIIGKGLIDIFVRR